MSIADPYASPAANLERGDETAGPVPLFSFRGRIGRLRYLAYICAAVLLFYAVVFAAGVLAGITRSTPALVWVVFGVAYAAFLLYGASLVVRRAHDFNVGAAWTLGIYLAQLLVGAFWTYASVRQLGIGLGWVLLLPFWLCLLVWVLMILFRRGTDGSNRFGLPPPPTPLGVKILAFGVPTLMALAIGFVVVVAIPAFKAASQAGIQGVPPAARQPR